MMTLEQQAGVALHLLELKRRADNRLRLARLELEAAEQLATKAAQDLERARARARD